MTESYFDWLLFTAKRHAHRGGGILVSMLLCQAFLPFSPSSLPPLPLPPSKSLILRLVNNKLRILFKSSNTSLICGLREIQVYLNRIYSARIEHAMRIAAVLEDVDRCDSTTAGDISLGCREETDWNCGEDICFICVV